MTASHYLELDLPTNDIFPLFAGSYRVPLWSSARGLCVVYVNVVNFGVPNSIHTQNKIKKTIFRVHTHMTRLS